MPYDNSVAVTKAMLCPKTEKTMSVTEAKGVGRRPRMKLGKCGDVEEKAQTDRDRGGTEEFQSSAQCLSSYTDKPHLRKVAVLTVWNCQRRIVMS